MAAQRSPQECTIHFLGGIQSLTLNPAPLDTVEDVTMKCLVHLKKECKVDLEKSGWELAMCLPVFGLISYPEESVWLPPWIQFPTQEQAQYTLRVRFRPPEDQLKETNVIIRDYLFVQLIHDYISNKDGMAEQSELGQLMGVLTMILFLPSKLPLNHDLKIDHTYRTPSLHMLNCKRKVPKLYSKLVSESFYDRYWAPKTMKDKFKQYKQDACTLDWFIDQVYKKIVKLCPNYCFERYNAKVVDDHNDFNNELIKNGRQVTPRLRIFKENSQAPGFYFNETFVLPFEDIDNLVLSNPMTEENSAYDVSMYSSSWAPFKPLKLSFDRKEVALSFMSMIQGYLRLSYRYDHIIVKEMKNKVVDKLHCFGPMGKEKALKKLTDHLELDGRTECHLVAQSAHRLGWFTVHHAKFDTAHPQSDPCYEQLEVECLDGWKLRLHPSKEMFEDPLGLMRMLNQKYGRQFTPRHFKDGLLADINHTYVPKFMVDYIEPYEGRMVTKEPVQSPCFYENLELEKMVQDLNPCINKWLVTLKEDPSEKFTLVKLKDNKFADSFHTGLSNLHRLWGCDRDKFLRMYGMVVGLPESVIFEPSRSDLLTHFQQEGMRLRDIVEFACQVISILEVMCKNKIFHGNLRCRKFMVCENNKIKLADPGIGYYMDTQPLDYEHNKSRLPWLSPQKRKKLDTCDYSTEVYAVGTTLYELLLRTDDILKFENDGQFLGPSSDQVKRILKWDKLLSPTKDIVNKYWTLVQQCWEENPPPPDRLFRDFRELYIEVTNELTHETTVEVVAALKYDPLSLAPPQTKFTSKEISEHRKKHREIEIAPTFIDIDGERLGGGHFADVYRGTLKKPTYLEGQNTTLQTVAIKCLKNSKPGLQDTEFYKELILAHELKHENIVKLLHFSLHPQHGNILVMEFMNLKSMKQFVSKELVPNVIKFKLALDILKGMIYVSGKNVVHRDLAGRNILICGTRQNPTAKVSDFGLSRVTEGHYNFYRRKEAEEFNPNGMAPEYIQKYTTKGDVWSYGVVLWELFTNGKDPSTGYYPYLVKKRGRQAVIEPEEDLKDPNCRLPMYKEIPADLYKEILIGKCWKYNPSERPVFVELEEPMTIFWTCSKVQGE